MNYISKVLLISMAVFTGSCTTTNYITHDYLFLKTNCDSNIYNKEIENTITVTISAFQQGDEKEKLYRCLSGSEIEDKYTTLYNSLIDEAFLEERLDLTFNEVSTAREFIYRVYPDIGKKNSLSKPLIEFFLDNENQIKMVLNSEGILEIAKLIKKEKLTPAETFGLLSTLSSINEEYTVLLKESVKLPSLIEAVQSGLIEFFHKTDQYLYLTNRNTVKTAHTDRVGNAYLSRAEFNKLSEHQIGLFLKHESYHVASKYTYSLLFDHFIGAINEIDPNELKSLYKITEVSYKHLMPPSA